MTELHLHRTRAAGQAQQLVAQADAVGGDAGVDDLADGGDGVIAGLRIAGAVGQEHAIGLHGKHLGGGGLGGHHGDLAAAIHQHAQDVALHAEIVGQHLVGTAGRRRGMAAAQLPGALGPVIDLGGADLPGQVHALEAGEAPGRRKGCLLVDLAGHDAAILGALLPQDAGQAPGIDVGDGHHPEAGQVVRQGLAAAPAAHQGWQVTNHQTGRVHTGRFLVLRIHTGVADMGIGQGDDLTGVGRVGQDLLVTGHGGVEHHLADGLTRGTDGDAMEQTAVFQCQQGRCEIQGKTSGVLGTSGTMIGTALPPGIECMGDLMC